MTRYAIGLDLGTSSMRALLVDAADGREVATEVFAYPTGQEGVIVDPADPLLARQNPADYLAGIEKTIKGLLAKAQAENITPEEILGIGVSATGSTPLPVDEKCTPLALHERFKHNPNACAWLWKDHTSHAEAAAITEHARRTRPHYLSICGGTYSSEWFFSKIWHCLKADPAVFDAAYSWLELADYIPAVLTGVTDPAHVKRSVCAAGHKAMYNPEWGGLPDAEFLGELAPPLAELRGRLYERAYTADVAAGRLCPEWAERLGLTADTLVAVGAIDAHLGAVGAGIATGRLVKVMGTSTCDMAVLPNRQPFKEVPGLCGIVDGSILPGYWGFEAGQSAVGDIFDWFTRSLVPQADRDAAAAAGLDIHSYLSREAADLAAGETGLLALDWHNGNRCILTDPRLTGLILGLTLHSTAAQIYRALIEGTAFGARVIIERLVEYGVPVNEVVACGGIAEKNPFLMQIYADILGRPIKTARSGQTSALGAAVFAAVAAGIYPDAPAAQAAMTAGTQTACTPRASEQVVYEQLYRLYMQLHDAFGRPATQHDLANVMKELLEIQAQARQRRR